MAAEDRHELVAAMAVAHQGRLQRFLRSRVRNAADIPDLIQEVFLRLLRAPRADTIRLPERYVLTIARHVAQQHRLQGAPEGRTVHIDEGLAELRSGGDADPLLQVTAQQCLEHLGEAFDRMSPNVQATFLLCRRDGLTVDQISERLGISRPMAKKYLVKALTQFRKGLQDAEGQPR